MPRIRVEPGGVEVEVDFGSPLIEALFLAVEKRPDLYTEWDLFHDCECHVFVQVLEGEGRLQGIRPEELTAIRGRGIPLGRSPIRQTCQTLVLGDAAVRLLKPGDPLLGDS